MSWIFRDKEALFIEIIEDLKIEWRTNFLRVRNT